MSESHIDTRTPEEMYQQIYSRLRMRGKVFSEDYKHDYTVGGKYKFPFDKNSTYRWVDMWYSKEAALKLYEFRRLGDDAKLTMTQFSEPPQII